MEEVSNEQNALKKVETKIPGKNRDKLVIAVIIIAVLLIAFGLFGIYYYKTNMQAVVTFDGGKVTKSEYTIYYKLFSDYLSYYGYPEDQIATQIANKAGIDKILYQKAKAAGLTLSADDKKKVDDEFTADQIKQFTDKGIDPGQMKELYYEDSLINKYIDKLKSEVSNDDMLAYLKKTYGDSVDLKEYVTREILFKTSTTDATTGQSTAMSDADKAKQKAKAEDILKKVLAGGDFAQLAKDNSEDTGTKDNGGEYKVYNDSNTDETYFNAVKTLKVGEIDTQLVESQYGYHIVKLEAINDTGRTNSDTERTNYVNQNLDKYGTDAHMKIDTGRLNALVKAITGKDPSQTNNTTDTNAVDTNTTTENTTSTTNNVAQ